MRAFLLKVMDDTVGVLVCASIVPCVMGLMLLMVFHRGYTKNGYVTNNCHAWQTET